MSELNAKKVQCETDIGVLQKQLRKLDQEIKDSKEIKVGDIVTLNGTDLKRVVLFDKKKQRLVAFDKRGHCVSGSDVQYGYEKAEKNIFDNNLLNLDS